MPMRSGVEARAIEGKGLDGGRYRDGLGFYSATLTTPGIRELTLVEEERLDEVALDGLLCRRFRIGGVFC